MTALDLVPFTLLIDRIVEPARRHFRRMILPVAVPVAVLGSLASLAQLRLLGSMEEMQSNDFFRIALAWLGLVALFMLVYLLGFSVLTVASMDAVSGRSVSMRRAWLFVLRPQVFLTLLAVSAMGGLSFMFCIVPALYVVPILSFVLPAMVDEGLDGPAAIRRSVALAHFSPLRRPGEYPWVQVLAFLFVGIVISYALTLVVQLPFLIVQQFMIFRDAAAGREPDLADAMGSGWLHVPTSVVAAFATTVAWLYMAFGICSLFHEARRSKEGQDLRTAIDAMVGEVGSAGSGITTDPGELRR